MFKNLFDFAYKRSGVQALGFYLAFLLLGFLVGFLVGGVSALISPSATADASFEAGLRIGNVVGVIYVLAIFFAVMVQKKMAKHYGWWLLAILSGVLAIFGGALLGLIPVAVLTTKPKGGEKKKK